MVLSHESSRSTEWEVILKSLEEGLLDFQKEFPLEEFRLGDYKQYPDITLLTCSDARVPSSVVGPLFNRVFAVENIGNQVKTSEGSILYGLLHLRTPLMLVVGHSDCGAIKAADSDFSGEPEAIQLELQNVKASLQEAACPVSKDENAPLFYTQLAEFNVDRQIEYLLQNEEVAALVDKGELVIGGLMLDLHNVYGQGYASMFTININGKCQPETAAAPGDRVLANRWRRSTKV